MSKKHNRHKGLIFKIREFRAFMRLETCVYISCIAISGFLLFNPLSATIMPLFLAVFFVTGAGYAYNHIKDKEEDSINNKRLNAFITNGAGMPAIACMLAAGIFFSLFLPSFSLIIFILLIPLSIAYSRLRVKEIFLLKNLYTGFTIGLTFLIGAFSGGNITNGVLLPFLVAFFFGFMLNLLGDIRGYEGDLAAGVKTLPVFMGVGTSSRMAQSLFMGFSVYVLILRFYSFYPLTIFAFLISLSLTFEKHKLARAGILSSFIVFSAFLFAIKLMEVNG